MTEPSSVCNDRYWPTSRCVGAPCSLLSFTSMSSNTSEVFGEYPHHRILVACEKLKGISHARFARAETLSFQGS
ncbi:hypothetical protein V6N11_009842 [Hibiscus sabdariffa]|uniref:Uncharacterized protein n=1 Tax=Hibiscus sabdariffa TaxID=183260 RepID=A0ABR1ZKH3_9ROSI